MRFIRKVLDVFRRIFLLAYLVFIVLCVHSCLMSGPVLVSDADDPLPGSTNLLSVPNNDVQLSSGSYPTDTTALTAIVSSSDLPLLDSFTDLASVDFSGSTCYQEIFNWSNAHPDVSVRYTVKMPDGQTVDNTAVALDLSGINPDDTMQAASLLSFFPNLKTIELGVADADRVISADALSAIQASAPAASVHYALNLLGQEVSLDTAELDLSNMTPDQTDQVVSVLQNMNGLSTIHLGGEGNALTFTDIAKIHAAAPDAALDYSFTIWGVGTNLSAENLSFSHIQMNDQGAAVRTILPYMTQLKTLDMDSCGVSNENMAAIRNDFPTVDVIWRIWFAGYSVRTDVERILASSTARGGVVTDAEASKLRYCDHVKYLDLGHNGALTDVSFAYGMPNLEVLILAINNVSDITPLASCPKLEYLEINSTNVTDLSPLAHSTALRHLNIGRTAKMEGTSGEDLNRPRVTDISPLYGLKDLERLWIGSVTAPGIPAEQIAHMQECAPNCVINLDSGDPSQGEWRTTGERPNWVWEEWMRTGVFNDPLNERYQLLREQFQYDRGDAAYSLPQNDPLY